MNYLHMSKIIRIFAAILKFAIMASPVFKKNYTPEEKVAIFEKWIHQREEWEAHIRQVKAEKQMAC